jgi:hypothetical protein
MSGLPVKGSVLTSSIRTRAVSLVVAGTVVLGLMQLGAPVASAASSSKASSTVAAAKTTGAVPMRADGVASPALVDFTYDLSFRISSGVWETPAQFFGHVRKEFVTVFPIRGAKPLALGRDMDLRPLPVTLFNVRVATLVSNGWTFGTRPGHPEFPNGYIAFRFNKIGPHMYLKVHAYIPPLTVAGLCFFKAPCKAAYLLSVRATWAKFAANLTQRWDKSWRWPPFILV